MTRPTAAQLWQQLTPQARAALRRAYTRVGQGGPPVLDRDVMPATLGLLRRRGLAAGDRLTRAALRLLARIDTPAASTATLVKET